MQMELPEIRCILGGVAHGLDRLDEFEGRFLGTVITICDISYTIVEPKYGLRVPSMTMPHLI
ncbi:hypothetical protein AB0O01_29970 [Streptomyces sp. NPDC093252]|uniref:hypothetical protein n=1 Tax=Streptomyces sp. NPDC093252 TaxID=3154980 RepID=UPI003438A893